MAVSMWRTEISVLFIQSPLRRLCRGRGAGEGKDPAARLAGADERGLQRNPHLARGLLLVAVLFAASSAAPRGRLFSESRDGLRQA